MPDQTDTFKVSAEDVGELAKVKVTNDGAARYDAWRLATLEIRDPSDRTYNLICNKWLRYELV